MILARDALLLDYDGMRLAAASEAISALGLLTPETYPRIWHFLDARLTDHPSARCLAWRKHGEQLSDEEKKAAGLRRNAIFSREAYAELSEAGRMRPLEAHSQTLLRATFVMFRYQAIIHARATIDGSFFLKMTTSTTPAISNARLATPSTTR